MKRQGRRLPRQQLEPRGGHARRHEVALIEHEDQVLVVRLLLDEGLGVRRARAERIARVEHLDDNVGRIDHLRHGTGGSSGSNMDGPGVAHLEELGADPPRLSRVEDVVTRADELDVARDVRVVLLLVRARPLVRRARELTHL